MKRHIISLVIAIGASVMTAVFSAVVLAVTGIYLSGHGHSWHEREVDLLIVRGSPFNLIFTAVTILAFVAAYALGLHAIKKASPSRRKSSDGQNAKTARDS